MILLATKPVVSGFQTFMDALDNNSAPCTQYFWMFKPFTTGILLISLKNHEAAKKHLLVETVKN